MIAGNTNIVSFLRSNGCTHWRIKRSEKSEIIIQSDSKENQTTDECIAQFEQRVTILEPGNYFIEAYEKEAARNTWKKDTIYIKGETTATAPQQNYIGAAPLDQNAIEKITNDAIEKYKREEHYKKLELENKELRENADSLSMRFMERAEPVIGLIANIFAQNMGVAPKMVAGIKNQTQKTQQMPKENINPDDVNKHVEDLLIKWTEIDPDAIELLEKIVKLAQDNPQKYNMAKSFL